MCVYVVKVHESPYDGEGDDRSGKSDPSGSVCLPLFFSGQFSSRFGVPYSFSLSWALRASFISVESIV